LLNSGITSLPADWQTIPEGMHIHHIDENTMNNSIDNLEMIDPTAHGVLHATDKHDKLRFVAVADTIKSIKQTGMRATFDVKCFFPYNNYIAAGFVVHNCGKTVNASRFVASAQKKYPDRRAVFLDCEGTYDANWGRVQGVDIERLLLAQPETGEQAVDVVDAVIRAKDTSIVVVDSLPAMMPTKELEKSAEDATVALQARLIGIMVRKATQAILDERKKGHVVSLLLINQWRNKITMMGDPRSLPGGNALKFFVACRWELMNKEVMGIDANGVECVDHNDHSFKITKNKIGNGIRTGEFTMIRNSNNPLGVGYIDEEETVLAFAKKFGYFTGGGSSWRLDDVNLRFNKLAEATDYLTENAIYAESLKLRLIRAQRKACGLQPTGWE
jgi:recombination protein RecA